MTPGTHSQRVAVLDQVAGEGDHEQHLGDLAGLQAEGAELDPDPRAAHLVADERQHRQQQRKLEQQQQWRRREHQTRVPFAQVGEDHHVIDTRRQQDKQRAEQQRLVR